MAMRFKVGDKVVLMRPDPVRGGIGLESVIIWAEKQRVRLTGTVVNVPSSFIGYYEIRVERDVLNRLTQYNNRAETANWSVLGTMIDPAFPDVVGGTRYRLVTNNWVHQCSLDPKLSLLGQLSPVMGRDTHDLDITSSVGSLIQGVVKSTGEVFTLMEI